MTADDSDKAPPELDVVVEAVFAYGKPKRVRFLDAPNEVLNYDAPPKRKRGNASRLLSNSPPRRTIQHRVWGYRSGLPHDSARR